MATDDAALSREEYIRQLVDQWPPLTAEQRDRLATLLRPAVETPGQQGH